MDEKKEMEQLVIFEVAGESCGVDIGDVQEIIRMQSVTEVPKAPAFLKGVISLRGKVIPVVDLRERFFMEAVAETKETRIVVVDVEGQTVGMVVDAVTEVLRLQKDSIEPPSDMVSSVGSRYLKGIGKLEDRLIILLDTAKIVLEIEDEQLDKTMAKSLGAEAV